jgi:hypothetical protein
MQVNGIRKAKVYGLDNRDSIAGRFKRLFSSPQHPEGLWILPTLLSNGYQGIFPGGKAART